MRTRLLSLFLVTGAIVLLGFGCGSSEGDTDKIKIGVLLPLSGEEMATGESIKRGIEFAHKKKNASTIELIFEDSKCEEEEAKSKLNSLIDRGVVSVIGEVCSEATLAIAPIAEERQVVLMSPATTDNKLSPLGEYVFRTVSSDELEADFAAKFIYNNRSNRRLAVLFADTEYGKDFSTAIAKRFASWGGETVIAESFEEGSTDLDNQFRKIRDVRPDALFIVSDSPQSGAAALKKIEDLFLNVEVYTSHGLRDDALIVGAEGAAEGLVLIVPNTGSGEFSIDHLAEYSSAPGPFAAQGYDAYMVIADAIQKGNIDAMSIKDELYTTRYVGVSGNITFNEEGNIPTANYELFHVKDDSFQKMQ